MKRKIVSLVVILLVAVTAMAAENAYLRTRMQKIKIVKTPGRSPAVLNAKLDSLEVKLQQANSSFQKAQGDLDELKREQAALLADLDSMSEMSEMQSMRLQQAMDRMSKMMSTLSNLMKKNSETSQQIAQNLK